MKFWHCALFFPYPFPYPFPCSFPYPLPCPFSSPLLDRLLYVRQNGRTAVIMCTMYGCSTALELLCKRGADTNIADKVRALSLPPYLPPSFLHSLLPSLPPSFTPSLIHSLPVFYPSFLWLFLPLSLSLSLLPLFNTSSPLTIYISMTSQPSWLQHSRTGHGHMNAANKVEWSAVECSVVEWSGVEWSGVEWSGVNRRVLQYSAVKCSVVVYIFMSR